MAWKVELSGQAQRDLDQLDPQVAPRILSFLHQRAAALADPRSIGEAMKGSRLGDFWKYRVGSTGEGLTMKALLFYDMAPDGAERIAEHYPGHAARLNDYKARGVVLMAGPVGQPPTGALSVFTSREQAEAFARGDPFVLGGVVANWRVQDWQELLA